MKTTPRRWLAVRPLLPAVLVGCSSMAQSRVAPVEAPQAADASADAAETRPVPPGEPFRLARAADGEIFLGLATERGLPVAVSCRGCGLSP
jgi:hypothetical protein